MKKVFAIALLLVLVLSGCAAPAETPKNTTPPVTSYLSIHFIDVDQADCALLVTGDTAVLIDAGRAESGRTVLSYLQNHNIEDIDLMVGTHPHGDHIGGLPTILNNMPVDEIWTSHDYYDASPFHSFQAAATQSNLTLTETDPGTIFEENGLKITVIGPLYENNTYFDLNDTSLVLMVEFGQLKFLFTGDMETYAENQLINAGADLDADVLKVGHHGSYSSTGQAFLDKVTPEYGIICCGFENEYGHPHDAPMGRLEDAEVEIYRTDLMGNIVLFTDGKSINFTTQKNVTETTSAASYALTPLSATTAATSPTLPAGLGQNITNQTAGQDGPKSTTEIALIVGVSLAGVLTVAGVFIYIFKKK